MSYAAQFETTKQIKTSTNSNESVSNQNTTSKWLAYILRKMSTVLIFRHFVMQSVLVKVFCVTIKTQTQIMRLFILFFIAFNVLLVVAEITLQYLELWSDQDVNLHTHAMHKMIYKHQHKHSLRLEFAIKNVVI